MSLWSILQDRWQKEAKQYTYAAIGAERVTGRALMPGEIKAGQHYFKLTLAEMFLKNNRALSLIHISEPTRPY